MFQDNKKLKIHLNKLLKFSRDTIKNNRNNIFIRKKSSFDYVSKIDFLLEKKIIEFINFFDENPFILSEENIPTSFSNDSFWIIDPLDGTSNFISDINYYSISIAYFKNAQIKFGCVIDIVNKDIYTGFKNNGAYLNFNKIIPKKNFTNLIGVSSGLIKNMTLDNNYFDFFTSLNKIGKYRILGSQALSLCYVTIGRLKAAINYEAKIWDDAAGSLILQESGGQYKSNVDFNMLILKKNKVNMNLKSVGKNKYCKRFPNLI